MGFFKCIGAGPFSAYVVSALLFVLAYILYRIFLVISRRIFKLDGVWRELVKALRYPVLVIFLEIAAVISLNLLGIKEHFENFIERVVLIGLIATIGWLAASLTRALYYHFMNKYERGGVVAKEERALVTQILFFYRLIMFIIFALTFASILMTFPQIKSVGIGILGSAGIVGIALGIAARPILLNLIAGFQIAMTKTIKIGEAVFIENEYSIIESIHLTHVIARTWDLRRLVLPISYFIDRPFQNWDFKDPEMLTSLFIYCDYTAPVDIIRKRVEEIIKEQPLWNRRVWKLHVTNCSEQTIELRILMTAADATTASDLRNSVREKVIEYLQKEHPYALPCIRNKPVM